MRRGVINLLVLLMACVVVAACAVQKRPGAEKAVTLSVDDLTQGTLWRQPTRLDLTYKHLQGVTRWRLMFASDGMRKVDLLDAVSGAPNGELILVDGRTLLTRAVNSTRNDILEYVDDAMLSQQIATALLQQAFPAGPAAVSATHKISADDNGEPISAETIHTSRFFYPPWTLRGTARRIDADSLEFDLNFVAQINTTSLKETRMSLTGIWRREESAPKLPDDFSLRGWSAWRIRIGTHDAGGISTARFITTTVSLRYATLGDLRAASRPSQ